MKKTNIKSCLYAVTAVGLLSCAQASMALSGGSYNTSAYSVQPQGFGQEQNSLGIAAVYHQNIYSGVDSKTLPFPMINFTYNNFFIQNITVGYNAYVSDIVQASLIAAPDFEGYDVDDSDDLNGMSDTDPSINVGGRLKVKTIPLITTLTALHDVSGNTSGNTLGAKFATGLPLMDKRLILSPSVAFNYQDKNIVNYYYGVNSSQATPSRAEYSPGSTINTTFGLVALYQLSSHWRGNISYMLTKYGSEIADSPIVNRSTASTVLVGVSYMFGTTPS